MSEFEAFAADLLARLLEDSSDRFFILDLLGSLEAASSAALRGRPLSIGQSWLEWLPRDCFDEASVALNSVAHGSSNASFACGDSEAFDLRPLRDKGGDICAILAHWRLSAASTVQIGETSEDLEKPRNLAPRSERQRALGEFVSATVHELNNVLASASSALRLIGRARGSGPLLAIVNEGMNALDRGARLVRHIHDLAQGSDDDAALVSVSRALDGLSGLIRSLAGPGIAVEMSAAEDVGLTWASSSRLDAAILNLTANALDAMPAGGRLEISARIADLSELPPGLLAGDFVRMDFVYDCAQLGPEILGNAAVSKRRAQGANLGLAGAFEFAVRAGGRCVAATTGGTRRAVTLFLPRSDAQPVPGTSSPGAASAEP